MFWSALSETERQAMIDAGTPHRYKAHTVLFFEGDAPSHALVLRRGRVRISRGSIDGREIIIELRGPGDLVGELGPFDEQPRNATATAIDDLEVIVIPADRFRGVLLEHATIAVAMLSAVAKKLRQATDRRLADGTAGALARLCDRLVELADAVPPNDDSSIDIPSPFTQQELAEWVGVSRDAIVLALRDLRERSLVETGRRTIRLLDLDGLRKLASDQSSRSGR